MKFFKIFVVLLVVLFVVASVTGCTENQRAKKYGGSAKIELPKGQKLVTVTWKDENLWYLTRPMKPGEKPETYTFKEESSWGILSGTVTIVESQ